MDIEQWWPRLEQSTREWLIDNNGDVISSEIIDEIVDAGGPTSSDEWWVVDLETSDLTMPDDAIDWIEAAGNDEPVLDPDESE